jgi:hypothetical protein
MTPGLYTVVVTGPNTCDLMPYVADPFGLGRCPTTAPDPQSHVVVRHLASRPGEPTNQSPPVCDGDRE